MRPAFIYLDLGNVVVFFDRERAFRQMAAASGADVGTVRDVVMHAGLQQALERGDIRWPEFHAEFSRRTGTRCDPDALARAASDMFWLNVGVLPLIAACERAGVPMGILSNTCDPHWRFLTSGTYAVLPGGFREIVLSHEVGTAKPERSIYDLATARGRRSGAHLLLRRPAAPRRHGPGRRLGCRMLRVGAPARRAARPPGPQSRARASRPGATPGFEPARARRSVPPSRRRRRSPARAPGGRSGPGVVVCIDVDHRRVRPQHGDHVLGPFQR